MASERKHSIGYLVVRVDFDAGDPDILDREPRIGQVRTSFNAVGVWPSQAEAVKQVEELNEMHRHMGCRYYWQPTKVFG